MKQFLKRFTAIALLLCLTVSFVVPATYADTDSAASVIVYDFEIYNQDRYKPMFGTRTTLTYSKTAQGEYADAYRAGEVVATVLNREYPAGLNWRLEAFDSSMERSSFMFYSSDNIGLRIQKLADTSAAASGWAAFRLSVPQGGKYDLTVTMESLWSKHDIYLFPADTQAMSETDIEAKLTGNNLFASATAASKPCSVTYEGAEFASAGEYIIALKMEKTTAKTTIYLSNITLTPVAAGGEETTASQETTAPVQTTAPEVTTAPQETTLPEETTIPGDGSEDGYTDGVYDIELYNRDRYKPMFGTSTTLAYNKTAQGSYEDVYASGDAISTVLNREYPADLNWRLEAFDSSMGRSNFMFYPAANIGVRIQKLATDEATSGWAAFRLLVSQSGKLDLSLTTEEYWGKHDIYIFAADEQAMSATDIEEKLTADNLVANAAAVSKPRTVTYEDLDFASPGEYILVLKMEETTAKTTLYLSSIKLTPATEEAPTDPEHTVCEGTYTDGTYNFALYTEEARKNMFTYDGALADLSYSKLCNACGEKLENCLKDQYKANKLNWVLEDTSFGDVRILAGTAAASGYGGLRLRFDTDENGKVMYITNENGKKEEVESIGNWVAFRVKVAQPGTYTVTVNKDYNAGYTADMYIFPAAATMTRDDLLAGMIDSNFAGAAEFTASMKTSKVGDWSFEAAGEYIFLFKTTGTGKRVYFNTITLTEPAPKQPVPTADKMVYDFDQSAKDPQLLKKAMTSRYNESGSIRVSSVLEELYAAGQTYWKYETKSAKFSATNVSFREGCLRFKSSENFRDLEKQWISFRIKNPGTATYDIRLVSSGKSQMIADIYLIPAPSTMTLTSEKIENAMTAENLLVKGAIFDGEGTFYLGEYTFGAEEEYVLVINCTKGALLYLSDIIMDLDGKVADGTVKREKTYNGTVYNLNLHDYMDGIYTGGSSYMADKLSDMNARYAAGSLNWTFLTASEDLVDGKGAPTKEIRFNRGYGMRAYTTRDSWVALKIKSPGSGDFTVTLEHASSAYCGTVAMYVLPIDTELDEIWAATDPDNRIGKVVLTHETGSTTVATGYSSFTGYYSFEAGKEYILVLECYENSAYQASYGNMNLSKLIMERGIIEQKADEEEKMPDPILVAADVVKVADARSAAAVAEVNGHDYYFLPLEGKTMVVYDLDTGELVDQVKTQDVHPRAAAIGPDGKVWLGGSCKYLASYDPITKEYWTSPRFTSIEGLEDLTGIKGIAVAEDGMVYFTAYYGAYLLSYNPETKEFRNYGQLINRENMFISAITYYEGALYVNYYSSPVEWATILKVDPVTGDVLASVDLEKCQELTTTVSQLGVLGDDYLVAAGGNNREAFLFDLDTLAFVENDLLSGVNRGITEVIDGKQYLVLYQLGLYEYDIATKEFTKVPGFGNTGNGFLTATSYSKTLITLDGERCLLTFTNTGGHPRLFNLDTQEHIEWNNLVVDVGGASSLSGFASGPEGSNEIYFGAYNNPAGYVYNTQLGQVTKEYLTAGQTDSQIWYKNKLYAGNYSSTTLNEIDVEGYTYTQRWKLDHELTGQTRVYNLAAGDDRVFAGTIPDVKIIGGSITVYNTVDGSWTTKRNVIQDQAVNSMVYHDKLIYGTTTTHGGTDSVPAEGASAVVFVYDYMTEETIAILDPRDYISGLPSKLDVLYGITADPKIEENGRFWVIVGEGLFCFTFDRETKTFDVQEVISFYKKSIRTGGGYTWSAQRVMFDAERNYLYVSFQQRGGFQRIELEDWDARIGSIKVKSYKRIMGKTSLHCLMGEDGNIYFGSGGSLYMLPLNVTEEDWAIAGAVDQMILDIGDEITLESEAKIKEAYSAYANLSWYYKALIQNMELLREKESDLLECKIETVPGIEASADNYPVFQELMDEYESLNDRQQRYVKNFSVLKAAYDVASDLNDKRIAGALQERLDALKEKFPLTLEDEPTVLEIRADYDALTGKQSLLVDATVLLDAEAQIAELRVEFVKYVETLIQAIPDEITLEAEPAIEAAREGVEKLYNLELKQISYAKFEKADSKLRSLKRAKAAAEEVDLLIDEIGIVTLGDKERIAAAREACDGLNDTALQFLTGGKKLMAAQFILKALQTWGIPVITVVNAAVVVALVPSLRKKIFKTKKKESIEN